MVIIENSQELTSQIQQWRNRQNKIAFVATMGNLHQGHLSLVHTAKKLADIVVVSIFVNPLQFGPNEDFATYPRTQEEDLKKLKALDVDLVFTPSVDIIYPEGKDQHTFIEVPKLSQELCGKSRPVFFRGITTVVSKLFNMVRPDTAIFGEKDFQQLIIIKKLVADLAMPIDIIGAPIIREENGLAMSSRNNYLSKDDYNKAPLLYQTLCAMKEKIEQGASDFAKLIDHAKIKLSAAGFVPDYLEIRRQQDLMTASTIKDDIIILAAAMLGKTRLIDNIKVNTYE